MSSDDQRRAFEADQRRLFELLRDWPKQRPAPTLDELADAMGVAKSTVHLHRQRLKDKGLVHFDEGKARSSSSRPAAWPPVCGEISDSASGK